MQTNLKKYDITQCALYKCQSKKRLEHLLLLEKGKLKELLIKVPDSYHMFEINKKGTKKDPVPEKRQITAPDKELKEVQSRILRLLQSLIRPEWLISGEKGKCYIDNGKTHKYSEYFLTMDIKRFYNNCEREPVYCFFRNNMKTSPDVAAALTEIITYNKGIPTGCPTSQIIAFYAYQAMFKEINDVANSFGCIFTLYVDDMTFSSREPFNQKHLSRKVDQILRKYGHKPKYSKVKYRSKQRPKLITGTVVTPDHQLDIPNSLQKDIYDNFQAIKLLQDSSNISPEDKKLLQRLKGQIQSARNIADDRFPEIRRIVSKIDDTVCKKAKT